MELKDKIDLCLRFYDKIHFFWNWYAVVMIAVVGWSVSEKGEGLGDEWKVFISFAVVVYTLMNASGLRYSYQLFLLPEMTYSKANNLKTRDLSTPCSKS
jgi:hypothetical protein